jgi:hypothetical protein
MNQTITAPIHKKLATCYSIITTLAQLEELKQGALREGYKLHVALRSGNAHTPLLAQRKLILWTCAGTISTGSRDNIGDNFKLIPFDEFKFRVLL